MTNPLRVLLVEDSATDAKLVIQELQRTGRRVEFERVETEEAMRAALDGQPWDLVISDWSMPKFTAPAALAVLKEKQLDLPFIIVSGTIGEETAVSRRCARGRTTSCSRTGSARLTPAVERELRECKDRASRRLAEEALRESEARFRRLAESGIVGIVHADVDGGLDDVNEAYARMVGYSREEFLSRGVNWVRPNAARVARHR